MALLLPRQPDLHFAIEQAAVAASAAVKEFQNKELLAARDFGYFRVVKAVNHTDGERHRHEFRVPLTSQVDNLYRANGRCLARPAAVLSTDPSRNPAPSYLALQGNSVYGDHRADVHERAGFATAVLSVKYPSWEPRNAPLWSLITYADRDGAPPGEMLYVIPEPLMWQGQALIVGLALQYCPDFLEYLHVKVDVYPLTEVRIRGLVLLDSAGGPSPRVAGTTAAELAAMACAVDDYRVARFPGPASDSRWFGGTASAILAAGGGPFRLFHGLDSKPLELPKGRGASGSAGD